MDGDILALHAAVLAAALIQAATGIGFGILAGLPLGIVVFVQVSVDLLKLLAGLAVLFMALSASGLLRAGATSGTVRGARVKDYGIGVLSGAMSAGLAMPGPVAAAHMSSRGYAKETIRATILVMFVFSYSAAIAFQAVLVGVAGETLWLAATLVPATLIGVLLGRKSVGWISERGFRWLIAIILVATSVSLLAVSLMGLFGND